MKRGLVAAGLFIAGLFAAIVLSAAVPHLTVLWFAIAIFLALTRALLNSHFLSDVLVGAGTALITTREVLIFFFPALVRPWF